MVELNHRERTIKVKIVYYGPPVGGKTTNLQVLHRAADAAPPRRDDLDQLGPGPHDPVRPAAAQDAGLPRLRPAPAAARGPRAGRLRRDAPAGPEGGGLARLRGELRDRPVRGEPAELPRDDAQPALAPPRPVDDAARLPVQQARPARRAHDRGARSQPQRRGRPKPCPPSPSEARASSRPSPPSWRTRSRTWRRATRSSRRARRSGSGPRRRRATSSVAAVCASPRRRRTTTPRPRRPCRPGSSCRACRSGGRP